MEERRKLKRRYIMFYSRVFDRKTGRLLGYLSDLTQEGAMVISEEKIEPSQVMRLRMDLPEGVFDKSQLDFEAKAVWTSKDVDPHFFNTGFHLINISEGDIAIIEQIIQDYGFRER